MGGEWRAFPFEQVLAEPVRNGVYKPKAFHGRGAKIVNMGEPFAHPRLSAVPMKRVELSGSESDRFTLSKGDLLFARRSLVAEGAGKCSIVLDIDEPTTFESSIIRARLDSTKAEPLFLYYFFNSTAGLHRLDTIRRQVAVAGITGSDLCRLEIPVPPLSEQRAIAHILGTLDDKIEFNRWMNETLEAMARALFKSWFVDFDPVRAKTEGRDPGLPQPLADLFPDRFEDSELGEIPRGWRTSSVYDLATYINGAAYRAFEPNEERRGLPIIKIAELKAGITAQTRFSAVEMPHKYRIDTGDILFSWSGNPDTSIDIFVWTHGPAWLNQHIFRVVPRRLHERAFVLKTLRNLRPAFAEIARNKQTTGLGHVTAEDLRRLLVVWPPESVLLSWNTLVESVLSRSFGLEGERNTLAALRDTLLPKLISGELRVRDADKMIADGTV